MARKEDSRISAWAAAGICLILLALSSGCATQNEALEQARQAYDGARQDTYISQFAPVPLSEAGRTLRRAEGADDREKTDHLAYIARQRVELARSIADQRQAESTTRSLLDQREQLMLDMRNRQVQDLQKELSELKARNTARGPMITLGDVLFETARASLKAGAQQRLYQLVDFLRQHPDRRIVIEGHTDSRGSESYNQNLSERRATSVQDFLVRSGIDPGRIETRGYGENYPVATNAKPSGRLQNRRVEIYLPEPGKEVAERGR